MSAKDENSRIAGRRVGISPRQSDPRCNSVREAFRSADGLGGCSVGTPLLVSCEFFVTRSFRSCYSKAFTRGTNRNALAECSMRTLRQLCIRTLSDGLFGCAVAKPKRRRPTWQAVLKGPARWARRRQSPFSDTRSRRGYPCIPALSNIKLTPTVSGDSLLLHIQGENNNFFG